jgi:hypothetical protein
MTLEERIESFARLGEILRDATSGRDGIFTTRIQDLISGQYRNNPWFTPASVRTAIESVANELTFDNLKSWTASYPQLAELRKPVTVGVIMAGNIPLVGFHDFLCVLITGNKLLAKASSKDSGLITEIGNILCSINPKFGERIEFREGNLSGFDAVIATGSNNSSRYFEYYFGKYPNIIRKNRNSIGFLDGSESDDELTALGKDIFTYFGLGCRNISKIYLPAGYDPVSLPPFWESYSGVIENSKYANNYDYNKAVFLVNKAKFYDTGYLLLKEDSGLSSPVSVLHYEFYDSGADFRQQLSNLSDRIQCITGRGYIKHGEAQTPKLWDYADGIDTIEFLLKKNIAGIL